MAILDIKLYNRNVNIVCNSEDIVKQDNVIVKTDEGLEFGIVENVIYSKKRVKSNFKFIRNASSKDFNKNKKNNIESQKSLIKCRELIDKYCLNIKIYDAYYTFNREKLIFKFTAEDRVDFRQLAKKLANIYHTRIELKQVGVRDKAKEIGGCGQCGRKLCCKSFLKEFNSVSINMAKNQNIALNPNKINGICGRLLCCLKYEDECYKECLKGLPKVGKKVVTKIGSGKVVSIDPLRKKFSIMTEEKQIVECEINDCIK